LMHEYSDGSRRAHVAKQAYPVDFAGVVVGHEKASRTGGDGVVGRPDEVMLRRRDPLCLVRPDSRLKDLDDRVGARLRSEGALGGRTVRNEEQDEERCVVRMREDVHPVEPDAVALGGQSEQPDGLVRARREVEEAESVGRLGG
jgi:hypothetical protein